MATCSGQRLVQDPAGLETYDESESDSSSDSEGEEESDTSTASSASSRLEVKIPDNSLKVWSLV